jgi:pimeloyl-ACP methyl ester carboxylesterase
MTTKTYHRTATVNGRTIFYREAGDRAASTILLLHGLPTSSQMFHDLIPARADRFHLIAPTMLASAIQTPRYAANSPTRSTT